MELTKHTSITSIKKYFKQSVSKLIFIFLLFTAKTIVSQNPSFKILIDSTELNKKTANISARVKTSSGYFSITDAGATKIGLPAGVNFGEIEFFKFTVNSDTIIFPVRKIVDNYDILTRSEIEKSLRNIFNGVDQWVLYIDNIQYYVGDKILLASKQFANNNSNYRNFKVYGLKTDKLKYYIVKCKS